MSSGYENTRGSLSQLRSIFERRGALLFLASAKRRRCRWCAWSITLVICASSQLLGLWPVGCHALGTGPSSSLVAHPRRSFPRSLVPHVENSSWEVVTSGDAVDDSVPDAGFWLDRGRLAVLLAECYWMWPGWARWNGLAFGCRPDPEENGPAPIYRACLLALSHESPNVAARSFPRSFVRSVRAQVRVPGQGGRCYSSKQYSPPKKAKPGVRYLS
ncbi:hypothetical protein F4803DRAFT_479362 [Xylaria telfairii]|nr:hypothetical protein F4803DRAFT_479362 [Xylaria telfairii]